jgi:formylglycine-generating enzyme required for sulfatase activity
VEGALEDLGGGVMVPLVRIPAGEFVMGQTPITQAQWRAVMDTNPSRFGDQPDSPQRPVECVSWHDAIVFCQRLNRRLGSAANRHYTLPSEAQWEYACCAGSTTPFHFGEAITPDLANYNGNYTYAEAPSGEYRQQATPVGVIRGNHQSMFPANAWGLCDMHGNVREWCLDHENASYERSPADGSAWLQGGSFSGRALRGGSWSDGTGPCRSAYRICFRPDGDGALVGFRVVCLPQGPSLNS